MPVQDAVTQCKGYDTCIDWKCNKCYDPYLGTHTTCGKLTYYNCTLSLPSECHPIKCSDMNVDTGRWVLLDFRNKSQNSSLISLPFFFFCRFFQWHQPDRNHRGALMILIPFPIPKTNVFTNWWSETLNLWRITDATVYSSRTQSM